MKQTQPLITISLPPNIDLGYFREVCKGFYQYQIFHVSDFWEGLEQLLYAAHRAGDTELLDLIGSNNLSYRDIPEISQDVEVDYIPVENKSTIVKDDDNELTNYRIPVVIHSDVCEYQQDIWMNIPCAMKSCKHYCDNPEFFNCGYSAADIENPSEYSIAYQLGVPVEEVQSILGDGLSKLRNSILKEEYLEPAYDTLDIDGFCQCCNKPQETVEEYSKGKYCSECVETYSELGCDLSKSFTQPLEVLLNNTFRYHKNLNYQALALNVQVKDLTELYNRVGIIKNVNNVKASTFLTNKRPGRAIKIENSEYFNMNVLSALSYQKPSADILNRLKGLAERVNTFTEMESIAEYCR